jgi:uncharacterized protein YbcC (UPF0753/DUF2309 family)
MNAPLDATIKQARELTEAIAQACERIAPTWPLDQFIAVNPYWGWVREPIEHAAAELGALAGTRLTMPREWFQRQWQRGLLRAEHLQAVAARHDGAGAQALAVRLQALLEGTAGAATNAAAAVPQLLPALRDDAEPDAPLRWADLVTHQISQHCAAFFDDGQARWHLDRSAGLYGTWLAQVRADRGLPWRSGHRAMAARAAALPTDAMSLLAQAPDALGVPPQARVRHFTALLLSVNGWAAWCAYERWQARLSGRDDDRIVELLAIRAAWEMLLQADAGPGLLPAGWAQRWSLGQAHVEQLVAAQRDDWLLQQAMELAYQQPVAAGLSAAVPTTAAAPAAPAEVQAVFCIDVRSEVFRRALEASDAGVHTRGFAGFFGLPIAYQPAGSALTRPQLPGLLAPAATASEAASPTDAEGTALGTVLATRRRAALAWRQRWADLRGSAASGFSFVEACGLAYAPKLLADSLPSTAPAPRWEDTGLPAAAQGQRPRLPQATQDADAAAAMAQGILGAMGLGGAGTAFTPFAPLVLLAGHGSQSANNPHAAGLDCGACGGQTGEVNARALADLLNTPAVRTALAARGTEIPPGTHFLPGLHNTTTDEVLLYDTDAVPPALHATLARLRSALASAGQRARAERAASLGLATLTGDAPALERSIRERANDWAQVRPEWGLADNAAFIVAPRARSAALNLGGRSFLHDYDHRADPTRGVLELIMTAPMVVTNWINLQYLASTVDNRRYGSGNKVLHNVVGGHLGVFEGNGGDLRIGLPLQSLHDGRTLRHTPLRLSVFIEAPRDAIDGIIARHAVVRDLVANGWLHLLRIDPDQPLVEQHRDGGWHAAARAGQCVG